MFGGVGAQAFPTVLSEHRHTLPATARSAITWSDEEEWVPPVKADVRTV
ncbi:hypothetical protein J2S43_001422 [Catenuloplanes nepalensis]|uniref:Uncharacterized protein n=1 Tax=Catenuloplanes nepalensis TaxID=587533 RepID=A0ABT9MNE4_9ACTN|nr:hypothetical protein [Catenuloplanes nepalensis]